MTSQQNDVMELWRHETVKCPDMDSSRWPTIEETIELTFEAIISQECVCIMWLSTHQLIVWYSGTLVYGFHCGWQAGFGKFLSLSLLVSTMLRDMTSHVFTTWHHLPWHCDAVWLSMTLWHDMTYHAMVTCYDLPWHCHVKWLDLVWLTWLIHLSWLKHVAWILTWSQMGPFDIKWPNVTFWHAMPWYHLQKN